MLKLNLGLDLNLPKLLFLATSSLFFLPMIGVHPAIGQSNSYSCESYQTRYATIVSYSRGTRPLIIWDTRQPFCDTVSGRFQRATDNGHLRNIAVYDNRICGSDRRGGECMTLLFATDSNMTAQSLFNRLINNDPILGARSITQSNGREYFDLEYYLENVPESTNPQALENQ